MDVVKNGIFQIKSGLEYPFPLCFGQTFFSISSLKNGVFIEKVVIMRYAFFKKGSEMSVKELLLRFSIFYTPPLIAIGFAVGYFGIKTGDVIASTVFFMGCAYCVCWSFGKKNGRYFSIREAVVVVLGLLGIDFVLQLLIVAVPIALSPFTLIASVLVFQAALIVFLHCFILYFSAFLAKKQLLKKGLISDKMVSEDEPENLGEYIYELKEKYADPLFKKKKRR